MASAVCVSSSSTVCWLMTFSCRVCSVCLRFLVTAYDWIASNSRSPTITVWSGGIWLAKPVQWPIYRGLAGPPPPPIRFGASVERSSPCRFRGPPCLCITAVRGLRDRAKRDCRSGRKAGVAARHRDRVGESAGHHHRICVDELSALRGVRRERVSDAAVEIYRYRQGALRVPRVSARHQGGGGLDTGALHRQGRFRKISRRGRDPVQAAGPPDGADQGHADVCRQTARDERTGGRDLREGSGAVRQAHRRPAIRRAGVEGQFDADLLRQRRTASRARCRSRNWKSGSSRC